MEKRRIIFLGIIVLLIVWMIALDVLPIGSGNWNERQIEKIESAASSNNFCFAVMADNKQGFSTFHRIMNDVNSKRPLFAIDVGDIVADGEKQKYRVFYNEILKSEVPFLVAIGNHDTNEGGRANYFDVFGNFYYSFAYNNSLFIVLDNANEKSIDRQQMDFLESELENDYEHKFVFLHVPPFDPREYVKVFGMNRSVEHSMTDRENAEQFMELVSENNVTIVFTSHIHGYFVEWANNTEYIITGGAGGELLLTDPEHYFYHYLDVCVNNTSVNYELIKFNSPDPNMIDRYFYTAWIYTWYSIVTNRIVIFLVLVVVILAFDLAYEQLEKLWLSYRKKQKSRR